ncbi:uncharacterized protein LOC119253186 [Talpa occidentalis]|uniref:uncharacterized protein LOC119253186 n=1 Tax=Talpa occidentalis TaxID=50954 RepID=UPI00188E9D3F|nr:uncharacterized protein LOC119253186 [Talpa occidentalis]
MFLRWMPESETQPEASAPCQPSSRRPAGPGRKDGAWSSPRGPSVAAIPATILEGCRERSHSWRPGTQPPPGPRREGASLQVPTPARSPRKLAQPGIAPGLPLDPREHIRILAAQQVAASACSSCVCKTKSQREHWEELASSLCVHPKPTSAPQVNYRVINLLRLRTVRGVKYLCHLQRKPLVTFASREKGACEHRQGWQRRDGAAASLQTRRPVPLLRGLHSQSRTGPSGWWFSASGKHHSHPGEESKDF